jgi:hypothetical protein
MKVIRLKQAGSMFYFTGSNLDSADPIRPTGDYIFKLSLIYIEVEGQRLHHFDYLALHYRRDVPDTVGKSIKSPFCRPYGTDPDVYMSLIPAVNYWAIIVSPYGTKKA